MQDNEIILFETEDKEITLPVNVSQETVWLSLDQMAELFQRDRSVIGRHVRNIFKDGELNQGSTCAKFAQVQKRRTGDTGNCRKFCDSSI